MFTLALAAAIAVAPPRPVLADSPYACPRSAPWAIPSGQEAHPYQCVAFDFGEQVADPTHMPKPTPAPHKPVVHHPAPKHHAKPVHHPKPKHHAAPKPRKAAHR